MNHGLPLSKYHQLKIVCRALELAFAVNDLAKELNQVYIYTTLRLGWVAARENVVRRVSKN